MTVRAHIVVTCDACGTDAQVQRSQTAFSLVGESVSYSAVNIVEPFAEGDGAGYVTEYNAAGVASHYCNDACRERVA